MITIRSGATDDKLYGPGSYDMKAGAYMSLYAYRHLQRLGKASRSCR